jgi:hypothetical protein
MSSDVTVAGSGFVWDACFFPPHPAMHPATRTARKGSDADEVDENIGPPFVRNIAL